MSSFSQFWDIETPVTNEEIQRAKKAIKDEFSHDVREEIDPVRVKREDDKKKKRSDDEEVDDVFRRDLIITAVLMAAVLWKYS